MDNLVGGEEGEELDRRVSDVHVALVKAADTLDFADIEVLYNLLIAGRTISYIDSLLPLLARDAELNAGSTLKMARWLVLNAPDREAVKFGIAVWGLGKGENEREVFLTLACHEEFTVYAMVALSYLVPDEDHDRLWLMMAGRVHGWGRIRLVERLSVTEDPAIRGWLLREGYRNSVMHEYLAYVCATGGNLVEALRAPEVDQPLLVGAGEILVALISGGPAKDITDYADGAEAVRLFLGHLTFAPCFAVECFLAAHWINLYLNDESVDWKELPPGWSENFRRKMAEMAARIVARDEWRDLIVQSLKAEDDRVFRKAAVAADTLEIDTWPDRFERLQQGKKEQWHFVTQTDDPERMDRVVTLAGETLEPLCDEDDLGNNLEMDFVVRGLGRFPGKGWPLIRRSLQSPAERRRLGAVYALEQWGRETWSDEVRQTLEAVMFREQDDIVRESMYNVLLGRPLE